jgi:hypothetical protein
MLLSVRQYDIFTVSLHRRVDVYILQMSHVNNMDADMPGTVLLAPLADIFRSRRQDIPTCIFVLTDGQVSSQKSWARYTELRPTKVSDYQETIDCARQAVSKAQSGVARLRIFTLGIGSGASTALCQGLATAGNGSCMMIVNGEPLAFKAMRLVNAMQAPEVRDFSVDWGVPSQGTDTPHPEIFLLVCLRTTLKFGKHHTEFQLSHQG